MIRECRVGIMLIHKDSMGGGSSNFEVANVCLLNVDDDFCELFSKTEVFCTDENIRYSYIEPVRQYLIGWRNEHRYYSILLGLLNGINMKDWEIGGDKLIIVYHGDCNPSVAA